MLRWTVGRLKIQKKQKPKRSDNLSIGQRASRSQFVDAAATAPTNNESFPIERSDSARGENLGRGKKR
jgi:hypothetical protein